MNEFEWRRQLRDLRRPVAPRRDLWPDIEATLGGLDAPAARAASRAPQWLAAAAVAALSLLSVGFGLLQSRRAAEPGLATMMAPAARAAWKPSDPRLAGAAIELDAARLELRQAMRQAPDSTALQRLLERTEQQQSRLRHLDQAG
ncbi:hypothetical protein [Fulvimonas soli]|uniref:Uncharacterized protein n=1 Tax=Fulvimonas soli TaxID=155197 RepID=A0A316I7V3_9GAMM|nr:hypothetical protein [Fulvimonas soli]PWK88491.1 hypothetical protein C7456_10520 [Fulvimonas soli]TNY26861.1 hypothetical protein BV497_06395 [Fulvimonas soli]